MGLGKLCPHCGERSFTHNSGLFFCNFCDIEDANETICDDTTTAPSQHESLADVSEKLHPLSIIQEWTDEDMDLETTVLQNIIVEDRTPSRKRSRTPSVSSPPKRKKDEGAAVSCREAKSEGNDADAVPTLDKALVESCPFAKVSKGKKPEKSKSGRQLTLTDMFKRAKIDAQEKNDQSNICSSNRLSKSGISDADDSFRDPLANSTCDESGLSAAKTPRTSPRRSNISNEPLETVLSTKPQRTSPRKVRQRNETVESTQQKQASPCKKDESLNKASDSFTAQSPRRTSPRKKRSNSINDAVQTCSPQKPQQSTRETRSGSNLNVALENPTKDTGVPTSPTKSTENPTKDTGSPTSPTKSTKNTTKDTGVPTLPTKSIENPTKVTDAPTTPTKSTKNPTKDTAVPISQTKSAENPTKNTGVPTSPTKSTDANTDERIAGEIETFGAWCVYNYVLKGIVDELVKLGAKKDLRRIVKVLWYKYLRSVGAFGNEPRDKRLKCGLFARRKSVATSESERDNQSETDTESKKNRKGAVTKEKLFSIIYLSLLLNKDAIQLGDLVRFIRECRVSYLSLRHFVPEDVLKKTRVVGIFKTEAVFSLLKLRSLANKVAVLLDVREQIPVQNLVELCRRYCRELNLSDDIFLFTKALISATKPRMRYWKTTRLIHNYEARAMSFILFALKLLFGLDNATEHSMSTLTKSLKNPECYFDFDEWLSQLKRRRMFISNGTNVLRRVRDALEKASMSTSKTERRVEKLLGISDDKDSRQSPEAEHKDFSRTKITYLTDPSCYGDLKIKVVCKGANKDIRTISPKKSRSQERRSMRIKLKSDAISNPQDLILEETPCKRSKFVNVDETRFEEIERRFKGGQGEKVTLYLPEEQFWLCQCEDAKQMSHEEFDEYFGALPHSFRAIVRECARIIEQDEQEVMTEYNFLETYLCYIAKDNVPRLPLHCFDATLEKLIEKYKLVW